MSFYPIARYYFVFEVIDPIRLPEYAGSMLRGAFGQSLKRIACMTRETDCKVCPLYQTCPYPLIFEPPVPEIHQLQKFSQIPVPYIIEPPEWGERIYRTGELLNFSMVLIGQALEQLALIIYAWERAFMRGVGHGTAKLQKVIYEENSEKITIYEHANKKINAHDNRLLVNPPLNKNIQLFFNTPLRLQDNGRALPPEKLDARRLLMTLVRRVALLSEFHMGRNLSEDFQLLSKLADEVHYSHQLEWRDWTRFSSRQKQLMQLGGVIGTWILEDIPTEFLLYLYLGQWLHIGKNASFGLGQYYFQNI